MPHFVITCPREFGHMLPICNLGSHLLRRGHRVTVLGLPAAAEMAGRFGLGFQPLEPRPLPEGTLPFGGIVHTMLRASFTGWFCHLSDRVLDQGPRLLRPLQPDAILADQAIFGAGTLADRLGIPFITVCPSVPMLSPLPRGSAPAPGELPRSALAVVRGQLRRRPLEKLINGYRRRWNLPLLTRPWDAYSTLALICQGCPELDLARPWVAPQLVWVGSLTADRAVDMGAGFPWDRLDGRPIICASLGTVERETNGPVLTRIAQACAGLPYQLVIPSGRAWEGQDLAALELPGRPLVVRFAPVSLFMRSALVISHGGMSTTLETLSGGVPLLLLPHGADQPAVAARVVRAGVGLTIDPRIATLAELRSLIVRLLDEPSFRERARVVGAAVRAAGGAARAADVVESVLARGTRPTICLTPSDEFGTLSRP